MRDLEESGTILRRELPVTLGDIEGNAVSGPFKLISGRSLFGK
jgi:hypothetical protein